MYPFRNRVSNIFGVHPQNQEQPPNTKYDITNEFLTKILPLIQSGRLADENRSRINARENAMFPLTRRIPEIRDEDENQVIDLTAAMPKTQPTQTVYGGMSPYQEGLLKLREQELGLSRERLGATTELGQQKVNIAKFKSENPNLRIIDNKQGKMQAINPITGEVVNEWDSGSLAEEEKIALTQSGALDRIAATGRERMGQIDRQGQIQRELQELRGVQTIDAINRRAELEKELIGVRGGEARKTQAEKPDTATVAKSRAQQKYNLVINQHPEWRDYISLDENGLPIVAEVGTGIGAKDLTVDKRNEILKALGLTGEETKKEEKVDENKPPTGAKPGGKWITLKSGARIYQEP